MAADIEAKEVTVKRLFSPDFMFRIPIYQRPLSWAKDNYNQLFEDIYDAINTNQNQFFWALLSCKNMSLIRTSSILLTVSKG